MSDVVAGDDEVATGLIDASQHYVAVRVVGIPVVGSDPVEPRPEIGLHAAHEVAGEALHILDFARVLGRDDEPELVPVVPDPRLERVGIRHVLLGRVGAARRAVAGDAVPLHVA